MEVMAAPGLKSDILKVRLGEDTRRMVLYNTLISYDDLVLMLQRVFDGKLRSSDEVTLKYQDEGNVIVAFLSFSIIFGVTIVIHSILHTYLSCLYLLPVYYIIVRTCMIM